MPAAHRDDDARACGATTIVSGQSTVFVNTKLWSVDGDLNTHGAGALEPTLSPNVYINNKRVVVINDLAAADNFPHSSPATKAAAGSGDTNSS
jgi:hypothetical protein